MRVTRVAVQEFSSSSVSDQYGAFLASYQLTPASTGAPAEDPDSDGIANALEFVLGGNPKVDDSAILPGLTDDGAGGNIVFSGMWIPPRFSISKSKVRPTFSPGHR